jgi:hypothetical protein
VTGENFYGISEIGLNFIIQVNEILIDMILENRRAMAILNHYELPDFEKE